MTKPTFTLTAGSPKEPFRNFPDDRSGPFSAVSRGGNHQRNKGSSPTVGSGRVVLNKPSPPHQSNKLSDLIAGWLDKHRWIATRTRNAAAHLNRRWRDLTQEQKHERAFEYAEAKGANAFSLNLSVMVERRVRAAADPIKYLTKRLNGCFRDQGLSGLQYAFTFDVAASGKLHLHGAFILGEHDIQLVKVALRKAGGKFPSVVSARQLSVSNLHSGLGFRRYSRKAIDGVSDLLSGDRFEFVNQSLNQATEVFHETTRPKKWPALMQQRHNS